MFWRKKKKQEPRRQFERVRQTLQLPMPWLMLKDESGRSVDGEIIDLSENGLCLRISQEIPTGRILTLAFRDKELHATVKWCRLVKAENAFHCGLQLQDDSAKLLDEIQKVWSIGD